MKKALYHGVECMYRSYITKYKYMLEFFVGNIVLGRIEYNDFIKDKEIVLIG